MLDADLAALYAVETKQFVRAVKRNIDRFPSDFAFVLTQKELTNLKCQIGTSSSWGGCRTPPWAFTEQGAAMLRECAAQQTGGPREHRDHAGFCPAPRAIGRPRGPCTPVGRAGKEIRQTVAVVFDAIRKLMAPPEEERREIGYHTLIRKPSRD
jgi:hypothetical protein